MKYQPRFEAFMSSFARDDAAFNCTSNRAAFIAWISRCKDSAPANVVGGGQVLNQDAFTAHCRAVARDDLLRRFPA